MGGTLTTTEVDADGKVVTSETVVTGHLVPDPSGRPLPDGDAVVAAADDYDSWCESGTICGRKINNYTAEVKGNVAYGNQDGAIGAFDQVLRQSFDGSRPRWRGVLIWDLGPAINGFDWYILCRRHRSGMPDEVCGTNPWDPATISSSNERTWIPSSTGYRYNASHLSGSSDKYHDDFYGKFTASGYSNTWSTGRLHTGRWNSCPTCKYYQVPWQSTP